MCLAILALNHVPGVPVLIAANRDEFHARPTAAAAAWPDAPGLYAGRDLLAGGTWMGASDTGRYALLTNYREPRHVRAPAPSRGQLTEMFLRSELGPEAYLAGVAAEGARYNGFNLIVGDAHQAWYYSNRSGVAPQRLAPGLYGVSNHLLDTPWPKLQRLKTRVAHRLQEGEQPDLPALLAALQDRQIAADTDLPHTGIPLARERLLSSPFIVSPDYGTRCSSVLFWRDNGVGALHEWRFSPQAELDGESHLTFGPRQPSCLS